MLHLVTNQENQWLIKAELTRLAAGPPFIMLDLKRLLADDIAVDFSGAVHISCILTISSRLDLVLPLDTDINGQESEADAAQVILT